MPTVAEVWKGALPAETVVLAGEGQVDRPVSRVVRVKSRSPGLDPPRGEELVLVSTATLAALDPLLPLRGALAAMAERAVAVAVQGDVPEDAVSEAQAANLPLFLLPRDVPLGDVERDVNRFLSQQEAEWYRRGHAVLHELTALAAQGRGLDTIARHMVELSGLAAAFTDGQGRLLALAYPNNAPEQIEKLRALVASGGVMPDQHASFSTEDDIGALAQPVVVRDRRTGDVFLLGPSRRLGDLARLVLEAGATAGAIELAREHAVQETVLRLQDDVIGALMAELEPDEELIRRARRMGYDPDLPRIAVAAAAGLQRRFERMAAEDASPPAFHVDGERLLAFYAVAEEIDSEGIRRLGDRLLQALAGDEDAEDIRIGLSRAHAGPAGFRLAALEARRALELGGVIAPETRVSYFGDLGAHRLLMAIDDRETMREYYQEMLGPLLRYDRQRKAELVPTLDVYLRAGNAGEAALRLNLHRNSLIYRLRRVREITGFDLDDAETRLALHLALRVGDVLRAEGEE